MSASRRGRRHGLPAAYDGNAERTFDVAESLRIALLIESSRMFGRELLRGIADYSRKHGPWLFFLQEWMMGRLWKQRSTTGKKGVPRQQRCLPRLRPGRAFRRLADAGRRELDGADRRCRGVLSLPALPMWSQAVGARPAIEADQADGRMRGDRGDGWHVGQLCPRRRAGVAENGWAATKRIHGRANHGGSGLEQFFQRFFPKAVCILDFYHAKE